MGQPDPERAGGGSPGRRAPPQPRDRNPAVRFARDCQDPPGPHLQQAWHRLPLRAGGGGGPARAAVAAEPSELMSALPAPLTRFVGREAELAQAVALLGEARLLTLIGPGGAGKTRLALRLASSVADHFPDGVWFVDFSSLSGGEFARYQLAITLGVKEAGAGGTPARAVGRRRGHRQRLA